VQYKFIPPKQISGYALDSIEEKCNFRVSAFYQVLQKYKLIDVA